MPETVFSVVRLQDQAAFDEWRRTDRIFTSDDMDRTLTDLAKRLNIVRVQSALIQLRDREETLKTRISNYQGVIDVRRNGDNWMLKYVIDDLERDIRAIQEEKQRLLASLGR